MRLSVVATCLFISFVGISAADDAPASIRNDTKIPAQGLGVAFQTLAAVGEFTPDEALKRLLSGTGLTYRYLEDKTVVIVSVNATTSQED
jgi:hypothetical protein